MCCGLLRIPLRRQIRSKAGFSGDSLGVWAVIPNNPSPALKYPLEASNAEEHLVECCLQAQAVPTRSNPLRKNCPKLLRLRNSRSHHAMDAISVHTTLAGMAASYINATSVPRSRTEPLAGSKQRLSGLSQMRQCDHEVLRILVTSGQLRGDGGLPTRISIISRPVSVLPITERRGVRQKARHRRVDTAVDHASPRALLR